MREARGIQRRLRRGLALLVLLVALVPAHGDTELVLLDGRVLRGSSARRDGENYVLTLPTGQELTFPSALVKQVRLVVDGRAVDQEADEDAPKDPPGFRRAEPQDLAGKRPDGPTGLRRDEARTLAGDPIDLPRQSQQMAVFGEAARFQKDIVKNDWQPTTDWDMDPEKQNNFAPSSWAGDVVDHSWEPESAWDSKTDVLESSRSTWSKSVIDSSWTPTDAFSKKDRR